jgi:ABC-type transport system involved in multi-copper enzyme maturation permease subunit
MSILETTARPSSAPSTDRGMRLRQIFAMARREVRQSLFRGRSLGFWLLALLPVALMTIRLVVDQVAGRVNPVSDSMMVFAGIYQGVVIMLVAFFGCLAVFGGSIRREVLERVLHYSFLTPMKRRDVLLGKYLGATVALSSLLVLSAALTYFITLIPAGWGPVASFLFSGPGLGHLLIYLSVVVLAVAGYGAVFLIFGLFFKKPALPAIAFFGWEMANIFLPPVLKRFSILFNLNALTPVTVDEGPFAILGEAPHPASAVLGLLVLIVAVLALSAWKLQRTEILYGED